MLDGVVRQHLDPLMDRMGWALAGRGVTANAVTVAGCVIGIAAFVLIWQQYYLAGLVLLLISRLGDGLDGAVARVRGKTDYGGYLDIVLDFSFYGLIPLGFVLADPANNAVAGGVLIFSFYINGSSFLAYAIMAEKRQMDTDVRGQKSLYFTTGLAEATETIAVFCASCLFPQWFVPIAYVFAALCIYTTISRIVLAGRVFAEPGNGNG